MVAKVVGRRDLALGMGAPVAGRTDRGGGGGSGGSGGGGGFRHGRMSLLPLSEEERDVRLAELMSFGVDLPNEMLVTMLRCVISFRFVHLAAFSWSLPRAHSLFVQ